MNTKIFRNMVKKMGYDCTCRMSDTRLEYYEISKNGITMAIPKVKIINSIFLDLREEIRETYKVLKENKNV